MFTILRSTNFLEPRSNLSCTLLVPFPFPFPSALKSSVRVLEISIETTFLSHVHPLSSRESTWLQKSENASRQQVLQSQSSKVQLAPASADQNISGHSPVLVPARSRAWKLAFRNHREKRQSSLSNNQLGSMLTLETSGGGSS